MAHNHFLGLRLSLDSAERLRAVAGRLQQWELPARWTHPDDYHLTLVFLGELDDDAARYLPDAVAEVAGSQRAPQLSFCGLGAGGSNGDGPKYVFAAVDDPEQGCDGMRRDLCEVLEHRPEAAFRPHVTLCRPQPMPRGLPLFRDWPHLLEAHGQMQAGACVVSDIVLWRSSGGGATRYEELASWPLG
jgi:2'-5' RNA ligase